MQELLKSALFAAVMSALISGCGGSGGGSGGGGGGGTITEQQRSAAIDAVRLKFESLPRQDRAADAQTMVAFLRSRSEFVHAEISDDLCVWGWFPDLQPLCLINNEPPNQPTRSRSAPLTSSDSSRASRTIPVGKVARLYHMFGFVDQNPISDPRNDLKAVLEQAGYTVETPSNVTISDLRSASAADVIFTNTHGGLGFKQNDPTDDKHFWPHLSLWTDQQANHLLDGLDQQLQNDLKYIPPAPGVQERLPRVVRMLAFVTWVDLQGHVEEHYAITSQFVTDYMQFGKTSLWFNNACHGDDFRDEFDARSFKRACFAKGLGIYAGWDNAAMRVGANDAAKFAFDRLTGSNKWRPEDPPQRAFPWQDVYQEMQQLNPRMDRTNSSDTPPVVAYLHFRPNHAQTPVFEILAPSIQVAAVDEANDTLTLYGKFGPDQNQVSIGGQNLTIRQGSGSSVIVCDLPRSAAGDVMVSYNGRRSNVVQVTAWSGDLHYTETDGYFTIRIDVHVHFRMDVHTVRNAPGTQPDYNQPGRSFTTSPTQDSTAAFSTSGQYSSGGTVITVSGGGTIPFNGPIANHFSPIVTVDPVNHKMTIGSNVFVQDGITYDYVSSGAHTLSYASVQNFPSITLDLDAGFNAAPSTTQYQGGSLTYFPPTSAQLVVDGMSASFPPDPQAARSARQRSRSR